MRDVREIEDRVRAHLFTELLRRLEVRRLPSTCRFNHRHNIDYRKTVEGEPNPGYNRITADRKLPVVQEIGLCMHGAEDDDWPGDVCDDPADAQGCEKFEPLGPLEKEAIFAQFRADVCDADWLYDNLPQVYALLWVLQRIVTPYAQSMGFWQRLWLRWFARVYIEPETKVLGDPFDLLSGHEPAQLRQLVESQRDSRHDA